MKKLITICAAVAALALFAGNVQANDWGFGGYQQSHMSSGYGGFNQHQSSGYNGFNQHQMSSGFGGYGGGYGYSQPHQDWHNTSHFDYHPATVVPHGNHFHVNPGHYDLHQTGHYDRHW